MSNRLKNKKRVNFSIEIELNEYLTLVSKETSYSRTAIIEELLRQHLYPIKEHPAYSPIMRALDYRREELEKK